jgi:predicted kinase
MVAKPRTMTMMNHPRLYLLVGYPGAGKTTMARIIHDHSGAIHLWADKERRAMFAHPTHAPGESRQLYNRLNEETAQLLAEGKSVIFDTNFNFRKDRDHLRQIAAANNAEATVVWVSTPKEIAKQRAVHDRQLRNGYEFVLPESEFERMSRHLQPPAPDEAYEAFDGTDLDPGDVIKRLGLE